MAWQMAAAQIALGVAQMASSFAAGQESAKAQKEQLKLQKKQWELDVSKAYQDSLSTLGQLKTTYRQSGLEVAQTQANIESLDYWLGNYQDYYDYEMAQQQLAVDQQRNAVSGMFSSNIGSLRQMQEGLAQQQVLSAARGQTGSTARLLSAMARQDIINFAGEDMTLDAEGGTYGAAYTSQQGALDLAIMAMGQRQKDLEIEKQNKESDLEMQQLALQDYQVAQQEYLTSIGETLGSAIELGYLSGQTYDQLAAKVDEYRQFINADDAEYEKLKKELLKSYTPLDYRVTSYTWETESGGENQHGATIYEHTDYITWVKNKETDMWEAATSEQLKQLKKQYGKNYVKDYINANEVENLGDYRAYYDNGVLKQRDIIYNDTFQKKLDKLGSRPR